MKKIKGKVVDIIRREIFPGEILVEEGKIKKVRRLKEVKEEVFILPGFVDAHVHIESSMITPSCFADAVVNHGTVATVSDPHEIANVLGMEGVNFMVRDAREASVKIFFGAPSCVPATPFETSGAKIGPEQVRMLLEQDEIKFLSEMMNFPGVINEDPEVMLKIKYAQQKNKPIDGHAPGLHGDDLRKYAEAGIGTDHESFTLEEALEKIKLGMKIQIREGSAAKNFDTLKSLIDSHPEHVMFCLDDMHPDELLKGHINRLVKKCLQSGLDLFNTLRAACYNPVKFYDLDVGLLQEKDSADFVLINNLEDFNVVQTWIDGKLVYEKGRCEKRKQSLIEPPNFFFRNTVKKEDIQLLDGGKKIHIISVLDGELITKKVTEQPPVRNGVLISDTNRDILKLVVQNRYEQEKPAVGFVQNFGILKGGMVSTISHDSHNIICLGTDDLIILDLLEWVNEQKGGIAFSDGKTISGLPLPVGGIMSLESAEEVAGIYEDLDKKVKKAGSGLSAPFMTLSFLSLLVIPELKLGNHGLFDVNKFDFIDLYED